MKPEECTIRTRVILATTLNNKGKTWGSLRDYVGEAGTITKPDPDLMVHFDSAPCPLYVDPECLVEWSEVAAFNYKKNNSRLPSF